jgi:hypothetical protein
MIALPAPGKTLSDRQQESERLKQLNASEILQTRTDHRGWIKAILKRQAAGDDTLPGISIRFAREAMEARETK